MLKRNIILVGKDQPLAFDQFRTRLRSSHPQWNPVLVEEPQTALQSLAGTPFDVAIANLGSASARFLNDVWERHSSTIRYLYCDGEDNDLIMRCVMGSHQILRGPWEEQRVVHEIERALRIEDMVVSRKIKALVARMRSFPTIPSLFFEITRELESSRSSADSIGELIKQDLAISTKLIQLVNSAFIGLKQPVTDPRDAVLYLGLATVKSLVLSVQAFAQFDRVKPLYFSIDKLWRRSLRVGSLARQIALQETGDPAMAADAQMAGLLHDIGILVLATNLEEQYGSAMQLARDRNLRSWEAEKVVFGADHAQTGACLLSRWGLQVPVIEATAFHHKPRESMTQGLTPLTAVHVANALVREDKSSRDQSMAALLDEEYLDSLNLADRQDAWRALAAENAERDPLGVSAAPDHANQTIFIMAPAKKPDSSNGKLPAPAQPIRRHPGPVGSFGPLAIWHRLYKLVCQAFRHG